MKRSGIIAVCLMSALMLTATGCGNEAGSSENSSSKASSESSAAETTEAEAETATEAVEEAPEATEAEADKPEESAQTSDAGTSAEPAAVTGFRPGVWEGPDCLYYFNEDGVSGRTSSYAEKIGVPFEYEMYEDGSAVFHFGAADDNTKAKVLIADDNRYTYSAWILWENDTETRLNYYLEASEYNFDNFYSDSQLVEKVKEFYTREKGVEPSAVLISGENGMYAPVEVYVDNEYVTTYSVNRNTLYAEDIETHEEYRSIAE